MRHGYLIQISFAFTAFLKSVLSISFRFGLPPCFLHKINQLSFRFKEFSKLLFAGCIVIDNCCNHLQIGSLFYSDYPNSQFPFSSLAVNFFSISFSFDYIHCQGYSFNLIFFFLFLSILVTLNLSNLTFSLLYPRIRIVNQLNFFISCIDHKPLLVICHGQYY